MPNINFSFKDFQQLLGKRIPLSEFSELVTLYAKGELEAHDQDQVKVELDDTNMPYLWCVEGLARFFRGILNIEKGLPKIKVTNSSSEILVDGNVRKVRPYIACFTAKGKIDNYLLEQLIQFQEKFCEGYGKRRQKVSIGLYAKEKIKFPVHYKAVDRSSVKFAPLDMKSKINLAQVLEKHPKGRQYGWIINNFDRYPLLVDDNDEVLSLVPIINSNFTGKLTTDDSEIMFEATGTDDEAVNLAANIFAQNLYDRGFRLENVTIDYGSEKIKNPKSFKEHITINSHQIENLIGLKLSPAEIKNLLEKARYGVSGNVVTIPDYRRDILHVFDVIEDIAIVYGFNKIESEPLTGYTVGSTTNTNKFVDKIREINIGLGFQEILSPILSNKTVLEEKMCAGDNSIIEIENIMSETFSAIRNWLVPIMLEVFSKNKHNDYPQKIFEQGLVSLRHGSHIVDNEMLAVAISHTTADFTEIKQHADDIFKSLGLSYAIEPIDKKLFIKGRGGKLIVRSKEIGIIGEVSPEVLTNWQLEMPVAVCEINLSELESISSSL